MLQNLSHAFAFQCKHCKQTGGPTWDHWVKHAAIGVESAPIQEHDSKFALYGVCIRTRQRLPVGLTQKNHHEI